MNTGKEILKSGVIIDWDSRQVYNSKESIFKLQVSCLICGQYRLVLSTAVSSIRKGKQARCWDCHKKNLALTNSTGSLGRYKNSTGYIVRSLSSFPQDKTTQDLLKQMVRSNGKKNSNEILEHRAILALHMNQVFSKDEVVHHINGDKTDNRIENLELLKRSDHSKEHAKALKELDELRIELAQLKKSIRKNQ